ncbi:hypothetical protein [Azospirillum doebereinerae]
MTLSVPPPRTLLPPPCPSPGARRRRKGGEGAQKSRVGSTDLPVQRI